jgi:pimeloyl-ACP methyl ester carboxylesterase
MMGIFVNTVLLPRYNPMLLDDKDFAPDEQWMPARSRQAWPTVSSHIGVHNTDPQTLAYALADSPVGTAAWLWERRRAWSDCDGDVVALHGRDFLCNLASLYWLTNTIGTSMRIYKEAYGFGNFEAATAAAPSSHDRRPSIPVPTGVAIAPKDVTFTPRRVVAERTNLTHWAQMPRGGHFLPAEQPDLLADEFRAFFATISPGAVRGFHVDDGSTST